MELIQELLQKNKELVEIKEYFSTELTEVTKEKQSLQRQVDKIKVEYESADNKYIKNLEILIL